MKYRYRTDEELHKLQWGIIPKAWKQSKAQYYFDVFAGGTPSTNEPMYWDGNIPWINSGEVQNCLVKNISRYITDKGLKESSTKLIPKNTTLLAMTGATCGNVGYLTFESTANQSVMAFVPRKHCISKFLYYYLMCQTEQIEYYKTGGAQGGINVDNGKKIYINIPTIVEQEKIANFLDEKTSHFDSIISKKEELIKKLEEAKKSLISEVVTGKVKVFKTDDRYELVKRSSDEMKDSGVEWLGEIPNNWEVKPLYTNFIENKIKNKDNLENNVLSLSYGKIKRRNIESNLGLLPESFNNYQVVDSGNIIFRLTDLQNDKKSLRVGLVEERGIITSAYVGLKVLTGIEKYFYYLFHYYDLKKLYYNLGAGVRQSMSFSDLKKLAYIHPNIDEQNQIANCLEFMINKYDTIIYKNKYQIEKLKEAKQSLISEAVTGKIEILD